MISVRKYLTQLFTFGSTLMLGVFVACSVSHYCEEIRTRNEQQRAISAWGAFALQANQPPDQLRIIEPYDRQHTYLNASLTSNIFPTANNIVEIQIQARANGQAISLDDLRLFPQLERLELRGCTWNCESAIAFRYLKSLIYLDATASGISRQDMQYLLNLKQLKTMKLSQTNIDDEVLYTIRHNHSLRVLNLSNTNITNSGLETLSKTNREIEILDVSGCSRRKSQSIGWIFNLRRLTRLSVSQSDLTPENIRLIVKYKQLRCLTIYGSNYDEVAIGNLERMIPQVDIYFKYAE